jgi:hypothetical protein
VALFDGFRGSVELVLHWGGSTRYPAFADADADADAGSQVAAHKPGSLSHEWGRLRTCVRSAAGAETALNRIANKLGPPPLQTGHSRHAMADRGFDLEFAAGLKAKADTVADATSDPALRCDPRGRGEPHARGGANDLKDCRHRFDASNGGDIRLEVRRHCVPGEY